MSSDKPSDKITTDKFDNVNFIDRREPNSIDGRRKTPYERLNLRQDAELKQAKLPVEKLPVVESFDSLVHELHVHQIELEMQNEELRRTHAALEESRDQYLSLFEFAPVGYLTLTLEGLITEANFTAADLLGMERKKLLSRPLSRHISPEDINRYHLSLSKLVRLGEKQNIEVKIQRSSNELCYMHIDAVRVQSDDGDVTLRATLTDITERKQSEQKLRIAATAFEVQEGILVTDEHKIIVQVNKSFTRITGYQESEVIGQHASILSSGQHDARFFQAMWEEIKSNQFWQGELWNKRKGGELFPAWMSITTVLGEDGYPSHYVGSFLDITLQKQAENVLLDARRHLEKQVERSVSELQRLKDEGSEVSTALKVMLKLRESESVDARNLLILELKQEVMPFLQKLRISSRDAKQVRLLSALDANLQRLISSYGCATSISSAYKNLTPKEIQVASMVREGTSTKVIASTLSLSPETISIHRKNIRKKLGLDSKSDNLRSYLITLDK